MKNKLCDQKGVAHSEDWWDRAGRRKQKVMLRIGLESKIQFQLQMERKDISGYKIKN